MTDYKLMKAPLATLLSLFCFAVMTGQPRYDFSRLATERLDRGVVAVRQDDGKVFISWRILKSDQKGEPFDVYRNGVKLNAEPLTQGGSCFVDEQPLQGEEAVYEVRGGNLDGSFILAHDAPKGYLSLPLEKPADGTTPDGRRYSYSANDASVADVDGDGQYELILKWDPSNAHDNAHDGFTGPTLIDCYKLNTGNTTHNPIVNGKSLNSKLLWRIDLGRNIRSGAHYVPFIVYDLDGDGRAELMVKTADGTRDGVGNILGDSTADYRHGVKEAQERLKNNPQEAEPQQWNRNGERGRRGRRQRMAFAGRRSEGRILTGPEYITVFDGLTGRALDTKPYIPERGELRLWGDTNANRSERYLAAVGYLDGRHASALFCRGYYTRTVIAAWDWDGHELKNRWTFDTNDPEWRDYAGQGNHNLRMADVDGDGCDELTYGSMAVDNDGRGLYNTRMGHGDALHLTAFDPQSDELQVWDCHENRRDGSDFRNARTGEVLFQIKSRSDVGRALAADIDPTNKGVEMWSSDSHGIRNIKGEVVGKAKDADDPQHQNQLLMNGRWLSVNFAIWWDGDLLRELLDHERVSKYDWENRQVVDVQQFEGRFNNGTKSNPSLQADMLGDWREEVVIRNNESTELRIYTTTIPTQYRIDCLMQDVPYRLSVATENVGYNQPPETGFYLGPDRTDYLK